MARGHHDGAERRSASGVEAKGMGRRTVGLTELSGDSNTTTSPRSGAPVLSPSCVNGSRNEYEALLTQTRSPISTDGIIEPMGT